MKGIKAFSNVQFKAGESGEFRAVFATFNVIDHDMDVTMPGAFKEGQAVRVAAWDHGWGDLPVGRGTIHQNEREAWIDGQFFLDTAGGRETYLTVKALGELQEWSYGYEIEDSQLGQFQGQDVQFLKRLNVIEVSPVMQGAGIDTRTVDIKGLKVLLQGDSGEMALQELHDMLVELGAKCAHGEAHGQGEAGDGKPRPGEASTMAQRFAIELLEMD